MSVNLSGRITLLTSQNEIPGAPVYNDLARLIKYISTDENINISINAAGGLDFSTTGKVGGAQNPEQPITPPSGGGGIDLTTISNYSYFNDNGDWVCNAGWISIGGYNYYIQQTTIPKSDFDTTPYIMAKIEYIPGGTDNNTYSVTRYATATAYNGLYDGAYYIIFSQVLKNANGEYAGRVRVFNDYVVIGVWV